MKQKVVFLASMLLLVGTLAGFLSLPADGEEIIWLGYDAGKALAETESKPVMIDFYADWCGPCNMLDEETYTDGEVQALAESFVCVKVNVDDYPSLADEYGVLYIPHIVFEDSIGTRLHQVTGFYNATQMLSEMQYALSLVEDSTPPDDDPVPPVEDGIVWFDYETGMALAESETKPAMIDFFTEWCGPCAMLDEEAYADADVQALAENFVCIKVDGNERPDLVDEYGIEGYPTIVFTDESGNEIYRVVGYAGTDAVLDDMQSALDEYDGVGEDEEGDAYCSSLYFAGLVAVPGLLFAVAALRRIKYD